MSAETSALGRTEVLLLAHAPLATAFAEVARNMGYVTSPLLTLDMPPDMSREQAFGAAERLLAERPVDGLLVLVDLGGGASPFAVAQMLQASRGDRTQVVAGLNSAMLMTALCHHEFDVEELALRTAQRARDGVQRLGQTADHRTGVLRSGK